MSTARLILLSVFGIFLCSVHLLAQNHGNTGKNAPDIPVVTNALAITNARVVLRPGKILDRGSVVVRNGLIQAVGASVSIPPDARVIDGTGLTVYAGFIDGYSWAGAPKAESRNDSVAKAGDPPNDRAGITPERDIRDLYNHHDNAIDSLRQAGFTVAHVVPRGGMLPGRGGLMFLGGLDTGRLVLRGDASVVARFNGANNVYPATPMGIMAKLRNLYRQAEGLKDAEGKFRSDPNGFERPINDPVRASFFGPISGSTPIVFQVNNDLQARRALLLSKELGFPLMLAGLKEGRDVADLLRQENTPLFLSLDFPDEIQEEESDSAATDDDAAKDPDGTAVVEKEDAKPAVTLMEESIRSGGRASDYRAVEGERLRLIAIRDEARRAAVNTPAFYHLSGTSFGFSTAGVHGKDLRKNLIEAVYHGLPEEAALAALTTDAAKMIGMERLLGTVEAGKAANFVITTGPYFQGYLPDTNDRC